MYRTDDHRQEVEKQYDRLMGMNPCLKVMSSATLIPLLLELVQESEEEIPMFEVEPMDEYMGIHHMQPLQVNGKPMFLQRNNLKYSEGYNISPEVNTGGTENDLDREDDNDNDDVDDRYILYTNEKVKTMYDNALSEGSDRQGIGVLDCTTPVCMRRVISCKKLSMCRQCIAYCKEGRDIVVVVTFTGSRISVKYPRNK
jgi:hypothetical protein